ncbi:MAG: hypothetical protein ACXAC8_04285 [Candidatus Hodarchaeales archaeon]|jgi:hypothetical protein
MKNQGQPIWTWYLLKGKEIISDLKSLKVLFIIFVVLHFLIGATISPLVTTDFERNLFYGNAFWEYGFYVYDKTPKEIDDSFNIIDPTTGLLAYPNTTYDYPTLQLLFWALVSPLPFSSILAKVILSCFDIMNFFLIYHLLKKRDEQSDLIEKGFALSYLFFSIGFTAIEGQSTALTVFFLLLPVALYELHPVLSYIAIGAGFHWKYVSVLVLPFILIEDRKNIKQLILGLISTTVTILLLSFPLLFTQFILGYFSFFGNLGAYSGQVPSNPLLLSYLGISSLLSTGLLILTILLWLGIVSMNDQEEINLEGLVNRAYWLPFLFLLTFLKIYTNAFPWYWMWFYPCLVIIPFKERRLLLGLLGITLGIAIIEFIEMTVGISTFIWYFL